MSLIQNRQCIYYERCTYYDINTTARSKPCPSPGFWLSFYIQKFEQSLSVSELHAWGQLLSVIKFALAETQLEMLRSAYKNRVKALQCNASLQAETVNRSI